MRRPRAVEKLVARFDRRRSVAATGGLDEAAAEKLDGPFVVERKGCRLHYWTAGQGDPTLVFSHGYTMDHRLFDLQVRAFRKTHRVLVWDVRGHGLSKPLGNFDLASCVDDLTAILEHAGVERPIHIGHSMGGYIAQELAFRKPEQVHSMVMLSTTCLTWRPPRGQAVGAPVTRALLGMWPHSWTTEQIGWIAGLSKRARRHASSAAAFMSKKERTSVWASILNAYHHEPDYRIPCPVLIMHGYWDFVVGVGLIRKLAPSWAAREPNARYLTIPRAAHNANQDNPAFTNRAIRDFVNGTSPAANRRVDDERASPAELSDAEQSSELAAARHRTRPRSSEDSSSSATVDSPSLSQRKRVG